MSCFSLLVLLLVCLSPALCEKLRTLVVVEDEFGKTKYSRFLRGLKKRGHKLDIRVTTDKSIEFQKYGVQKYENIIILAPKASSIGDKNWRNLLDFMDNGGNILIGLTNGVSESIRKFTTRCGVEIHSSSSVVRDHFSYSFSDPINDEIIVSSNWYKSYPVINTDLVINPILYKGIGLTIKKRAHLTFNILSGSNTAYSDENGDGPPEKNIIRSGPNLSLIAALQNRKNSRITFIGSLDFLSDKYFESSITAYINNEIIKYKKSGNELLSNSISSWTFGEVGKLRATNVTHYKINDITINPNRYRIKDNVMFKLHIEEYVYSCNCYVPFKENDVQFEFIRLDPFIRQIMKHDNNGNYFIEFSLPDVFGIYKFEVNYKRRGWSYLLVSELVTVRPFSHNEYNRFIFSAFPYYIGSFSMLIGFVVFTTVFLFGKQKNSRIW